MTRYLRAALAAAASTCIVGHAALAQTEAPPAAPASPATPAATLPAPTGSSSTPTPAAAPDAAPAEAPISASATPAATPSSSDAVVVAFVAHTKAPVLIDTTPGKAAFAVVGAVAMIAQGHQIVVDNDIKDPSGDMAREIATAYAQAHDGRVADAPILDEHQLVRAKAEKLAEGADGARYIVDVDSPGMNLSYFPFDWIHFDMMFSSRVRIIDTSTGNVVDKARCFIKAEKTPDSMTHGQLLADKAANLKKLIANKSEACVVKLKAELKL